MASRLPGRIQLTTDGLKIYVEAVEGAFGADTDYAILVKVYGAAHSHDARRYSPTYVGATAAIIVGNPDVRHISTSYVERHSLTARMSMRRFTRLTNGFSKKLDNLRHAVALCAVHYNFCRRQTLRVTPAMEAALSNRIWVSGT